MNLNAPHLRGREMHQADTGFIGSAAKNMNREILNRRDAHGNGLCGELGIRATLIFHAGKVRDGGDRPMRLVYTLAADRTAHFGSMAIAHRFVLPRLWPR